MISDEWNRLERDVAQNNVSLTATSVSPLIQTKWNQSPYYNEFCPGQSVSGCVATGMAQLMKYWKHPVSGTGAHAFNHSRYGLLSADFSITSYQWDAMPASINSSNQAVATLMYHCGVSVDMDYSPVSSNAYMISSANTVSAETSLKSYFGYSNNLSGVRRDNYSLSQWTDLLKSELDAKRPVLYAGFGSGGGHCFITDGYDVNDYFHFNWGWGGAYDGYFLISALNPGGVGTGGGSGNYNTGHQALIGVEPETNNENKPSNFDLRLYKTVLVSPEKPGYGAPFQVATNIINNGGVDFSGDYCAAIFNERYQFVDYIETKTGNALKAGFVYGNDLIFSSKGLLAMLPGKYYAGIFYRPTGGGWKQLPALNGSMELVELEVLHTNDIELNVSMQLLPGDHLRQGEPLTVKANVINKGSSIFTGEYQAALYDLQGKLVEVIAGVTENAGLPAGYTYISPYLEFNTKAIKSLPGSFLLALSYKRKGSEQWQFAGQGLFVNPVKVVVEEPALQPDPYEQNNAVSEASLLPLTFTDHKAHIRTSASSCHKSGDHDFYKLELPAGSDYVLSAEMFDAYHHNNSGQYTLDAVFSFSTDAVAWSAPNDESMKAVTVKGGRAVYFYVTPYFPGEAGSYVLDITVSRSVVTATEDPEILKSIKIYPNPAATFLFIDLQQSTAKIKSIKIFTANGHLIYANASLAGLREIKIPVANQSAGVYFLHLATDKGLLVRKVFLSD